ncbi:class I SAM-dependent methyltransferase [Streptomyces sp. NPDC004539]|uniref:class I SAM-dependent methyltransferase n=1 Tax=Streptomyces sp. NPDC004539 TaxID=3154280 RepID=UPI0033B96BF8
MSGAGDVQEAFLRDFHAGRPGVTGEAFSHGRSPDGRSSYELLRDRVSGCARVLDLGCGDGVLLTHLARPGRRLAGIDLSPEAVAVARGRGFDAEVGRAQELPYADGAFDAVVSHMAFMLMADADRVVAEVGRVLVPGGVFACVIGGGAVGGEAYERFVEVLRGEFFEAVGDLVGDGCIVGSWFGWGFGGGGAGRGAGAGGGGWSRSSPRP